MDNILNVFMAIWFLVLGLICIKKTQGIQEWFKNIYENLPAARAWGGFFEWTQKPSFITITRVLGVLSMLNFFMLVYVIMYGDSNY